MSAKTILDNARSQSDVKVSKYEAELKAVTRRAEEAEAARTRMAGEIGAKDSEVARSGALYAQSERDKSTLYQDLQLLKLDTSQQEAVDAAVAKLSGAQVGIAQLRTAMEQLKLSCEERQATFGGASPCQV